MADKFGPWLTDRIRSFSPEQAADNVGASGSIEQLAYAWRGLSGHAGSVFGMAVPGSWGECDVPAVKESIEATLNRWLTLLPPDEAAHAHEQLLSWQIPVVAPAGLPAPPSSGAPVAGEAFDTSDLLERVAASTNLIDRSRWDRFAEGLARFADRLRAHPSCAIHTPLELLPPLRPEQLVAAQAALDCPVPDEVLCISSQYCSGIRFAFARDFRGLPGAEGLPDPLLDTSSMDQPGTIFDVGTTHELLGLRDWELDDEDTAWTRAFPLLAMESDCLVLDAPGGANGSVRYLSHEEGPLEPNLGDGFLGFLETWLSLGLIDLDTLAYTKGGLASWDSPEFRNAWANLLKKSLGFSFDDGPAIP